MEIEKIIFDLDGVIYRGDTIVEGVESAIEKIEQRGIKIYYMTNNSTLTREMLMEKLQKMRIKCTVEQMMTTAYASAQYLSTKMKKPKKVYVVGEEGLKEEIRGQRIEVLDDDNYFDAEVLICGLDRELEYRKLTCALNLLLDNRYWLVTNLDKTWPYENGFKPGVGAVIGALAYCAGEIMHEDKIRISNNKLREPNVVIGKPSSYMIELLIGKNEDHSKTIFVGDRLYTDIRLANINKMKSVLVLTGDASEEDARNSKDKMKPDYVLKSVAELPELLKK